MSIARMIRQSAPFRHYVRSKYRLRSSAREELFTGFYRDNIWGDAESRSGAGSSLAQTERLRAELPALLRDLGVTSLLDAPCGDFAWMQHVDLDGIAYVGGDIVTGMVDDLQRRYGGASRRFVRVDLASDPLPHVDAVMIRDLFLHLPNTVGLRVLANVKRSGAKWLLASTYPGVTDNPDVLMGQHRFPNLTLPPFGLPAPFRVVDERPTTADDRPDKQLAVWSTASF